MEFTTMYSPVPNGEHLDVGEESYGESADAKYAEDTKGDEDESEESDDEVQSPPRIEHRSKQRHEPAANLNRTLVSSTRNVKRDQAKTPESTEKAAKQSKPAAPKPWKALPHMKVVVPVASTAAASVPSAPRDDDQMDVDTVDAATSQRAKYIMYVEDYDEPQFGARGGDVPLGSPLARPQRTSLVQVSRRLATASSQGLGDSSRVMAQPVIPLSSAPPASSTFVV